MNPLHPSARQLSLLLVNFWLILVLAGTLQAQSFDNWYSRSPLVTGETLQDVAVGNGLLVAVGDGGSIVTSPDGTNWTIQALSVDSISLFGVIYGDGNFVAVGAGGILRSADGQNWIQTFTNQNISLQHVAFGNGVFVAVGIDFEAFNNPNIILTSRNGMTWAIQSAARISTDAGVAFGNGQFVILSEPSPDTFEVNSVLTSSNGTTWICQMLPGGVSPHRILFVNGVFAAVGDDLGFGYNFEASVDGMNWVSGEAFLQFEPYDVAFANGVYVAVGFGIQTSFSGLSWTQQFPPGLEGEASGLTDIVYAHGTFVAVGGGGVILQSDRFNDLPPAPPAIVYHPESVFLPQGFTGGFTVGVTGRGPFTYQWQKDGQPIAGQTNSILFVAQVQLSDVGLYRVAVSNQFGGTVSRPARLDIGRPDPLNFWHVRDAGLSSPNVNFTLRTVTYANGMFVGMGLPNLIITSTNGAEWTRQLPPFAFSGDDITFGNGMFVALNFDNDFVGDCTTALSSKNGILWTNSVIVSPPTLPRCLAETRAIAFGNGRFVAVGQFEIYASTNGFNWVLAASGFEIGLRAITFGDGRFVAVGYSDEFAENIILTSTDGFSWTFGDYDPYFPPGSNPDEGEGEQLNGILQGVAYGNGLFVATGLAGFALTSSDGIHWFAHRISTFEGVQLGPIGFGAGRFAAAPSTDFGPTDRVWVSDDGMSWQTRGLGLDEFGGAFQTIHDIAYGNNTFLLVGDSGLIIQSDPLIDTPPSILRQPLNRTVGIDQTVRLQVEASGSWLLQYHWFKDGVALCVTDEPTLSLGPAQLSTAGNYHVVVRNPFGSATSAVARVVVEPNEPILRIHFDFAAQITILGRTGATYGIECKEEFDDFPENWQPVRSITMSSGEETFTDWDSTFVPKRFYRLVDFGF